MTVYYNENDKKAAAWLNELIRCRHIAPGIVDTRSIEDVTPNDLRGFKQCHFFAGIGVWSYALRGAGWSDDTEVWTASCPCQPFSASGAQAGFLDERHLWSALYHIIDQYRPAIIIGEQVAQKAADVWVDLVQNDLEAVGYAFGAIAFPAASIGAPHLRDRTYWMADSTGGRPQGRTFAERDRSRNVSCQLGKDCEANSRPVNTDIDRCDTSSVNRSSDEKHHAESRGFTERLVGVDQPRSQGWWFGRDGSDSGFARSSGLANWIYCRDGKYRPIESGTLPLAHGSPARVGRLRGYGNVVVAPQALEWVRVTADACGVVLRA